MEQKHVGAASEHKAVVWLLEQGLEVFRNVSAHGKVDLVSRHPETGELRTYDVTTGSYYERKDGEVSLNFAKNKMKAGLTILVVCPDGRIAQY